MLPIPLFLPLLGVPRYPRQTGRSAFCMLLFWGPDQSGICLNALQNCRAAKELSNERQQDCSAFVVQAGSNFLLVIVNSSVNQETASDANRMSTPSLLWGGVRVAGFSVMLAVKSLHRKNPLTHTFQREKTEANLPYYFPLNC